MGSQLFIDLRCQAPVKGVIECRGIPPIGIGCTKTATMETKWLPCDASNKIRVPSSLGIVDSNTLRNLGRTDRGSIAPTQWSPTAWPSQKAEKRRTVCHLGKEGWGTLHQKCPTRPRLNLQHLVDIFIQHNYK